MRWSGNATISASKKLSGIMYRMLKDNFGGDDFPNFVVKTI